MTLAARRARPSPPWGERGQRGRSMGRWHERDRTEEHLGRAPHPLAQRLGRVAVEPVRDRAVHQAVEIRLAAGESEETLSVATG